MSLVMPSKCSALMRMSSIQPSYRSLLGLPNNSFPIAPEKPIIALKGVRSSWLIFARMSDFARLAISNCSIAFCSLSSVRFFSVILSLIMANYVVASDSSRIRKFEVLSQYRSPDFRVFDTLLSHYPVRLNSS